ncbi:hypothetical protein [Kocuria sp.]|uniref:hypothetical protein n=1 Tax=Kocuria sp. TaxID=1871328 RepID=UPI0026DF2FD3|nr:hypothetical protein [Kocuria sp.]MDO5618012.1 hypothetical protein [Kocuria sp.]
MKSIKRADWEGILGCDTGTGTGWQIMGYELTSDQARAWNDVHFIITDQDTVVVKNWPLPDDAVSPWSGRSLSADAVAREVWQAVIGDGLAS